MSNSTFTPGLNNQEWAEASDNAREAVARVGEMASHAAAAVGAMASQAACGIGQTADDLTASAGAGIRGLGDKFAKSAPRTGTFGNASQSVAQSVKDSGKYLEGAKLSGISEDLAELVRRNPVPAVLLGIGLGWFLWRTLRS